MQINAYSVLQVTQSTPLGEIRKAYYRLAKQYHPDVYKGPDATAKMQQINAAYKAIQDEKPWSFMPPSSYTTPPPPPKPVKSMAENIAYAKTHKVSDQFLIELIVGGRDKYSSMRLVDLFEAVEPVIRAKVKAHHYQERIKGVALRWYLRGLPLDQALRKAVLDDGLYRKGK